MSDETQNNGDLGMTINQKLQYVLQAVNDLFDASAGSAFPEISEDDLRNIEHLIDRQIFKPSLTAKLSSSLLCMINENVVDENALAPNAISEIAYERCIEHGLDEDTADKISDAVHMLANELVSEPPTYL